MPDVSLRDDALPWSSNLWRSVFLAVSDCGESCLDFLRRSLLPFISVVCGAAVIMVWSLVSLLCLSLPVSCETL